MDRVWGKDNYRQVTRLTARAQKPKHLWWVPEKAGGKSKVSRQKPRLKKQKIPRRAVKDTDLQQETKNSQHMRGDEVSAGGSQSPKGGRMPFR